MPRSDDDDNIPCKTPSPRSSASQAPPNPRHNVDEPPPRINLVQPSQPSQSSHPFKGLSRKFMSKKDPDHKRGRSEGAKLDLGPSHGPYDTPNVRDRVRKWQAAGGGVVMPGDIVDVPPISPATPTPGTRRGVPQHRDHGIPSSIGSEMRTIGSEMRSNHRIRSSTIASDLLSNPLSPPRGPAMINREEWDSASEAEKEAERQRAKSKERARKMKRRRDRERGVESKGVTPDRESTGGTGRMPTKEEDGGGVSLRPDYDDGIRVTPFQEDDGIRVTPIRMKRSGSRRKRRNREKLPIEETGDELKNVEVPEPEMPLEKPPARAASYPIIEPAFRKEDPAAETKSLASEKSDVKEVKAWENDDGIRIYTSKPNTPVSGLIKSERGLRQNSVRQSAKSVKSRKDEFEAQMKKERIAREEFEELVRKQEEEARLKELLEPKEKHIDTEHESLAVRNDTQTSPPGMPPTTKQSWQDYDDGIRVRPLKTKKSTRRKKSSEGLSRKRSKSMHQLYVENTVEPDTMNDPPKTPAPIEAKIPAPGSAPATPTGRTGLRRDTEPQTPLSVKDRARRFDQGLEPFDDYLETSSKKQEKSPAQYTPEKSHYTPERSYHEESPIVAGSGKKQRLDYDSPSHEPEDSREKRRRERRELRRAMKEAEEDRIRISALNSMSKEDLERPPVKERPREVSRETPREIPRERSPEPPRERPREKPREKPQEKPREKPREKPQEKPREKTQEKPQDKPQEKSWWEPLAQEKAQTKAQTKPKDNTLEKLLEKLQDKPRETPAIPPRPNRERRKSMAEPKASSIDKFALRKEKTKSVQSTPSTPFSSTDSLPLRKEKPPVSNRSTADEIGDSRRSSQATPMEQSPDRPVNTPKISTPTEESTTPLRKKTDSPFGPKLSFATSTFFKVLKEEFQGKSVRVGDEKKKDLELEPEPEPEPESESEPEREGERGLESEPEPEPELDLEPEPESLSESTTDSESDSEVAESTVKAGSQRLEEVGHVIETPAHESESVSESVSETSSETSSSSSSSSSSDSQSDTGSEQTVEEVQPEVRGTTPEPEKSLPEPEKPAPLRIATPIKREKSKPEVLLEEPKTPVLKDTPELPKPRRNLRNTPSPPRPKSVHSRAGSDGSLTPKNSIGSDNRSAVSDNRSAVSVDVSRNLSDASTATVKPLRFNKSKKTTTNTKPEGPPTTIEKVEETEDWYNPEVSVKAPSLKRKYTKHADLISILSVPRSNKSLRSAARSRSGRSKGRKKNVETLTIADLMDELTSDELRYMRELRTLVEDVVPVLFQTVLGRADDDLRRTASTSSSGTSATASSRSSRAGFSSNPTRPIVDMGITLERLKTLHERIPRDPDQFLAWASDAKRVYEEYLSVWRMGFQDVVVTMPPPLDDDYDPSLLGQDEKIRRDLEVLHGKRQDSEVSKFEGDPSTWAMPPPPVPEEEEQDEKVDVAFLLKRPLVRLKLLAKLLKRINYIDSSTLAESLSNSFHALVTMARRKISDEKARIEDEAAASLDVTNVCDMNLLLPRSDVSLDQSRRVKARDLFAMRLYHSSGEMTERSVELILRDPSTRSRYSEGEVLIVEVGEGSHKWLLFPPIALSAISARTGDAAGEIVVMVRGLTQHAEEWREIMALASATAAGFEWVQMLGLVPIPPEGPFAEEKHHQPTFLETVIEESIAPSRQQTPVEKPKRKKKTIVYGLRSEPPKLQAVGQGLGISKGEPELDDRIEEQKIEEEETEEAQEAEEEEADEADESDQIEPSTISWLPPDLSVAPMIPEDQCKILGGMFKLPDIDFSKFEQRRSHAKIEDQNSVYRSPSLHTLTDANNGVSPSPSTKSVSSITRSRRASRPSQKRKKEITEQGSAPSIMEKYSQETLNEGKKLNRARSVHLDEEERPKRQRSITNGGLKNIPTLLPSPAAAPGPESDTPPPVPPHRSPAPSRSGTPENPPPSSAASSIRSGFGGRRRTSSPLKHEYAPSSASESGSEPEIEVAIPNVMDYQDASSSSSSSEDEDEESDDAVSLCSEEEDGDYPLPMLSIPRRVSRQPSGSIELPRQRPSSISSSSAKIEDVRNEDHDDATTIRGENTVEISPPDTMPPPIPQIGIKFRAFVFKWGTNSWDKLHPTECKIIITPGHIEGYPLGSSSPSSPGTPGSKDGIDSLRLNDSLLSLQDMIFSLDLLPETPIRRGTAVDISIRTPKTSNLGGANIMLRSRSPNECEMLFNGIQSNINYPADYQTSTMLTSIVPSEMGTTSVSSATFGGSIKRGFAWTRGKTYRAGMSTGTPSLISTPSETSVGSIASAFSRFRPKGMFKNSSLSSVASSASTSMMGDGSRGGTPTELSNLPGIEHGFITMSPMKVRLYLRETPSKWRDLGNARLNVLNPPDNAKNANDKRVVVTNKKGNIILLDTVLGEQSFERVARTGIAISILTSEGEADGTGKPGDIGGIGAKNTVYMMQMKGEAEAAYSFSILGKLRY